MTDNKRQAHCKVLKMILNGTKPEVWSTLRNP